MFHGQLIGKAVAEIEPGGVKALAPSRIGLRNAVRRGLSDRHDIESEAVDQLPHLRSKPAPFRNDQCLSYRAGGK